MYMLTLKMTYLSRKFRGKLLKQLYIFCDLGSQVITAGRQLLQIDPFSEFHSGGPNPDVALELGKEDGILL